ncbi:MAG: TIGR00282 family metallophosphoesterase [Kordiimonadaceae bacterium]|nr:TIGR00282 family metallophosphoesterase [Kordiimonadaceae bacterium]MBT6032181.1 TIGR00282 family metallophosphoesterase [Kordiimonadaceae bacterium]
MKIIYLGDILGRSGRKIVAEKLPEISEKLKPDAIIVNGENAAAGFGITGKISDELFEQGIDVISTGNHIWDQKDIKSYINNEPRLIRPINFPTGTPGKGSVVVEDKRGRRTLVINVMGRVFMDPLDDPFRSVDEELKKHRLGSTVDFILVDVHAEATSEKMAMGQYLDGRVSCVVGTHCHIPTADAQIFDGGTAYQTDAGMCGDYNSVIGMDKVEPINRFLKKVRGNRFAPALGEGTLCGIYVESDNKTGLATRIEPIRMGARLKETFPDIS